MVEKTIGIFFCAGSWLRKTLLGTIISPVFLLELFNQTPKFASFGKQAVHKLLEAVFCLSGFDSMRNVNKRQSQEAEPNMIRRVSVA